MILGNSLMYKLTKIVFSTITILAISNTTFAENVLSKTNTDSIFKMQKHEWEKIAPRYVLPFGEIKINKWLQELL